ncbi:MAG: iron-sulfur cluster assembly scaffold protein [Desulfosalsimonas sp.]|uniref:iron-sulfur cluster assembly scaffold protein n=1 Tax=Desulfosalsimonas sp. TaxID=3073848 RepID=UPI003970CC5C
MDNFDRFVNDLQAQIFDEARAAYGEKGFDRWQNPRFNGGMAFPDGWARVTGECGDSIEIYLKFGNDIVTAASYLTDGCASSSICGSFAAELAMGKDPEQLIDITGESVLNAIGRLPEDEHHCARLAAAALQEALSDYMSRRQAEKRRMQQE